MIVGSQNRKLLTLMMLASWLPGLAAQEARRPRAVFMTDGLPIARLAQAPEDAEGVNSSSNETATEPPNLQTVELVQKRIGDISNDVSMEAAVKERLLATLTELVTQLKRKRAADDELAAIEKALDSMADSKRLAQRQAEEEAEATIPDSRWLPIEKLYERKAEAASSLAAARQELDGIVEQIDGREQRIANLPDEMTRTRDEIESLNASSVAAVEGDLESQIFNARTRLREAKLEAAQAQLSAFERERAMLEAQKELLPLQRKAAEKIVALEEAELAIWGNALSKKRQYQIEQDLTLHEQELPELGMAKDESLVLRLKKQWLTLVEETEAIQRRISRAEDVKADLSKTLAGAEFTIKNSRDTGRGLSSSDGIDLQLKRRSVPNEAELKLQIQELDEEIQTTRDLKAQVELTVEGLADDPESLLSTGGGGALATAGELPESERELLRSFDADLGAHLVYQLRLKRALESQQETSRELVSYIDSHLIWVQNASPLSWKRLGQAWLAFRWMVQPTHLLLLPKQYASGLAQRPELAAILLLLIGVMAFGAKRMRRRIAMLGASARKRSTISLRPTMAATILSLGLATPLLILLWVSGDAMLAANNADVLGRAWGKAFHIAAFAVLPIEFLRQILRRDGLAVAHFDADESSIRPLRYWLRLLIDIGLPILIFASIAHTLGRNQAAMAMTQVLYAGGMVLLGIVLWNTLSPRRGVFAQRIKQRPNEWFSKLAYLWFLPILLIPFGLAILVVSGFDAGAIALAMRLYWTFCLCLLAYYVGGIVRRTLLTQRRRLTLAVHRERVEERQRLESGVVEIEPSEVLEAAEISAQTSRLLQTTLTVFSLAGIAWIWSPVLPVVGYLESVPLWNSTNDAGEIQAITLANVVTALPIFVLTWASVRNLPGLLEGVLLERLPLDKAARYAITTLATYAMVLVGVLIGSQVLGVRWENIQWLVAALGVGLGFGLQEIFANFISGLILLFEQPIRVGDVVTIDDTTGVVARIRIRATTVTNWDRQELVIPNKDLITGRLINWTLTDTTNRLVLHVGIAYGSDTDQACELLREICDQNENLCKDPAPLITFEGFGDSTLNLVVRCYLASLDNRLSTTHDLHTTINRRFSEAGLEIAFPQRDLHLRSVPVELIESLGRRKAA